METNSPRGTLPHSTGRLLEDNGTLGRNLKIKTEFRDQRQRRQREWKKGQGRKLFHFAYSFKIWPEDLALSFLGAKAKRRTF